MIIPEINRIWRTDTASMGIITAPDMTSLFTLELPWKNNRPFISCVPNGLYPISLLCSKKNKDIGNAYELNVGLGRTLIRIHIANYPRQIEGCIALGFESNIREESIGHSEKAIRYFMDYMAEVECNQILIKNME